MTVAVNNRRTNIMAKTIRTKVFSINELGNDAKEKAIENVRKTYYDYNDFASWAIDDCSLFEPQEKELEELLKENYRFPLLKNNRTDIYFSTDREWYLDCSEAIEVTNNEHFLLWLGVPREIISDVEYNIHTPTGRNESTVIEFTEFPSSYGDIIDAAVEKFSSHINSVLKRIEADIDYRFTDDAIIEDAEANEYLFTKEGKRFVY